MPTRRHPNTQIPAAARAVALAAALAAAALIAGAIGAPAASSGASASPSSTGGGATYVARPRILSLRCIRGCASRGRARGNSILRLSGRALDDVRFVTFHGSYGRADDRNSRVRPRSARWLDVRVPVDAETGRISAAVHSRLRSAMTRPVAILPPPPPDPNPTLTPVPGPREPGAPQLETATSLTQFYFAGRAVRFSYRVRHDSPVAVQVELVRASDGAVVHTWTPPAAQPDAIHSVLWHGSLGGLPAPLGRYAFRLVAQGQSGAVARSSSVQDTTRDATDLRDHIFPIRGPHDFGGAGSRFGTGRAGHSHQGHDVFARCGVPLVAAQGGIVKHKAYHRAAGYYLVIRGAGSGIDYAYMHLAEPTPFVRGDRVLTGQRIGAVGQTGNARGCHLHFEMWGKPGWYDGGRPFDPLPALRAWDAYS